MCIAMIAVSKLRLVLSHVHMQSITMQVMQLHAEQDVLADKETDDMCMLHQHSTS
jgi:hypothetical protein